MQSQCEVVTNSQNVESQNVKTSGADLSTFSCKKLSKCKEMLVEGQEKEIVNNKGIIKEDKQIYRKDPTLKINSGKVAWASNSSEGASEEKTEANEATKESENPSTNSKPTKKLCDNKDFKSRFTASSSKTILVHSKSSPNKTNPFRKKKERISQQSSRSIDRPNSWHGGSPRKEKQAPVRIHNYRGVRCIQPNLNDQSKYSYNTSEFGCPYKPPKKPIVTWVSCNEGRVQPGAIVAGKEFNNPYTFIGRVTLRNERCMGRIVPMSRCCFFIRKGMEHKRFTYEVLVNTSPRGLVWRRDYNGHVPDSAIQMGATMVQVNSKKTSDSWLDRGAQYMSSGCNPLMVFNRGEQYYRRSGVSRQWEIAYFGRARINKGVIVPGYVVPSHGVLHSGYDNRETIRSEYEVLCEDKPCSLKYLVAKKIRDRLREVEKINRRRYATKVQNAMSNLERLFTPMCRKEEVKKVEDVEDKLELPATLVDYLKSPKNPNVTVLSRLDFNTILNHCCSLDENCPCSMWVDISLQGVL